MRSLAAGAIGALTAAAAVLACGTPPPMQPPPPPPDPPIVCCSLIARVPCPIDPCNFEYWIICYGRIDGNPLFVSNPMPLPNTQRCICAIPPLPPDAVLCGAQMIGLWFTNPTRIPWDPTLINDEPSYGPFEPIEDAATISQIDSFFDVFYAAGGVVPPPSSTPFRTSPWGFSGNVGAQILPGLVFNVYTCIRVPRGFPDFKLCVPLQEAAIGLFLQSSGQVLIEPLSTGQPPIPFLAYNPFQGAAIYKFRWYPTMVPPSCPPSLAADVNGDGIVDTADLGLLIGDFLNTACP
jgi:hypothetical protein